MKTFFSPGFILRKNCHEIVLLFSVCFCSYVTNEKRNTNIQEEYIFRCHKEDNGKFRQINCQNQCIKFFLCCIKERIND